MYGDGKLKQEMQGNYILALKYHMVPEEMESRIAARLAEMIVEHEYKPDAGSCQSRSSWMCCATTDTVSWRGKS